MRCGEVPRRRCCRRLDPFLAVLVERGGRRGVVGPVWAEDDNDPIPYDLTDLGWRA